VPTRLLVLLTLAPYAPYTYAIATTLAAILAAVFTYLFCRRIKLGARAAATAGYTFVACGYFSARVAVGHLPLLEVYAALPALLWAVEALIQATERHSAIGRRVFVLALLTTCVMLGGHPQLPVYAIATRHVTFGGRVSMTLYGLNAVAFGACPDAWMSARASAAVRSAVASPGKYRTTSAPGRSSTLIVESPRGSVPATEPKSRSGAG